MRRTGREQRIARILKMRAEGMTWQVISARVGLSVSALLAIYKKHGKANAEK